MHKRAIRIPLPAFPETFIYVSQVQVFSSEFLSRTLHTM
jgi:hypothetical protein